MRQGGSGHGWRSGTPLFFFGFEKEFLIQREGRQDFLQKIEAT